MQANIFKIEQASVSKNPEKGTVIYFKGCPLRCSWCSNPQLQNHPTQIMWDSKRCLFCRLCVNECPSGSLQFEHNTLLYNSKKCIACRDCVIHCPSRMLHFVGTMMTLEEVMEIILQNRSEQEGGDRVTLSGGDPLLQPKFAGALLRTCREQGLRTTVETTGCSNTLDFSRLTAHTDLLYLELKHYSERKHVQFTGVSNQSILANLDFALMMRIPVIVRSSIIPGINNSLADAQKFAELLCAHKVTDVELIHFSMLGERKYEEFHMPEALAASSQMGLTNLEDYADVMRAYGLHVKVSQK